MKRPLVIDSKLIGRAEYDSELEELTVSFSKTGDTWKYLGVPQLEVNSMEHATSPGSYFLTRIRDKYKEVKL